MKRKDFWKGFGVALALVVVLNLAWKPICRAIPWHLLPFEISMSKDAKVDMIQSYLDKYYVEDIDQGKLEDTLFAGMLAGVGDKYTYYMPKENLRQYHDRPEISQAFLFPIYPFSVPLFCYTFPSAIDRIFGSSFVIRIVFS